MKGLSCFNSLVKYWELRLFASNSTSTLLWFSWTREVRLLQTPDNNGIPPFLFSQRKAFRFSLIIFVIEAPLLPKLRGYFAEFLRESCLTPLVILYLPTCVGRINPDLVFRMSNYQLQYYQGSSVMWTQDIGLQLYRPMGIDIKRNWPNLLPNGWSLLIIEPKDLTYQAQPFKTSPTKHSHLIIGLSFMYFVTLFKDHWVPFLKENFEIDNSFF